MRIDVLLLAAGIGSRSGLVSPKQFYTIKGKPMFVYPIEVFRRAMPECRIVITCHEDHINTYKNYIEEFQLDNCVIVKGGTTRQESVYVGLQHVNTEKVILHEAARPLISESFILELIDSSKCYDAVVPVIPISFTVAEGDSFMTKELDRKKLKNVQLPQIFNSAKLVDFHNKALKDNYHTTEDGTLFFHYGGKVRFIEGRESNIKVTTALDVEIINKLLKF